MSNCHRSGSRYLITSSTVPKRETVVLRTSSGSAEGGNTEGPTGSACCYKENDDIVINILVTNKIINLYNLHD